MPEIPHAPKKHVRLITIEVESVDDAALDEFSADILEMLRTMPDLIGVPPELKLSGIYVVDPDTNEEIDYQGESNED